MTKGDAGGATRAGSTAEVMIEFNSGRVGPGTPGFKRLLWQLDESDEEVPLCYGADVPDDAEVAGMFAFVFYWNSYLWPLTVLRGQEEQYPIVLSLGRLLSYTGAAKNTNLVMAGASLAVIPPLLVFAFLQRYFVRSISRSGFGG